MPAQLSGVPAWNSIPQKQEIGWSAAFHGLQWQLAVQWARQSQTGARVRVSGSADALNNPRNGVRITVGSNSVAFSVNANATWAASLFRQIARTGSVSATSDNTDVVIERGAASGSTSLLFVAEQTVNANVTAAGSGVNVTLVRF